MTTRLADKVALITGASAGIGYATAHALAREGANVVVTARREERLQQLVREVEALGARSVYIVGDAATEATARASVDCALSEFGRIDILINNAGVGNYKNLIDTSAEEYDQIMDVNMRSTFLFTRHVAPVMQKQQQGLILLVSSMAGLYGFPGQAVYCASKFAQVGFAQALDKELRTHGIKVGSICPGGVKTEFAIGKGRTEEGVANSSMLDAEDVAQAITFACTQPPGARIMQIQMRTMAENLN